jgi:hypothetical protein
MKKLLILVCFTFVTFSLSAQSEAAKFAAKTQVEKMNKVIMSIDESYALTPNQIVRLEKLNMEKRIKIQELKDKNLEKREFFDAARRLENEYKPAIDAVMTPDQLHAFYNRRRSTE